MQAFTRGMQWCCAAGEWDLPYQFDLARLVYIQPRVLVRTLCSSPMQSRMPIQRPSWNVPAWNVNGRAHWTSVYTCDVSLNDSLVGEMPVIRDQCASLVPDGHSISTCGCSGVHYHVRYVLAPHDHAGALDTGWACKCMANTHTETPGDL